MYARNSAMSSAEIIEDEGALIAVLFEGCDAIWYWKDIQMLPWLRYQVPRGPL